MRRLAALTVLLALAGARATSVAADGGPEHGMAIARQWCAPCHALPGSHVTSDAAPALAETVRDRDITPGALRAWLSTPHPQMPDLSLTRAEVEALVAYLRGLND